MVLTLFIKENGFNNIKDGFKNIEIRKYTNFVKKINKNDKIKLKCKEDTLDLKVLNIILFDSLRMLLENTNLKMINHKLINICEFEDYYKQLYKKLDSNYVAIYIELL